MSFKLNYNLSLLQEVENSWLTKNIPCIDVGDTIKLGIVIQEGNKERIQFADGVVIAMHKANLRTTVTVRKVVQGIGVERIYLVHSPRITEIKIIKKSHVRKAKLYYLRNRSGKATRLKQKFV